MTTVSVGSEPGRCWPQMLSFKLRTLLFSAPVTLCCFSLSLCPLDNAASEGVLASFFNSLLSKKTGSPGSPSAGGVQSTAKKSGTEAPQSFQSLNEQCCQTDGGGEWCRWQWLHSLPAHHQSSEQL